MTFPDYKTCTGCGEEKPLNKFSPRRGYKYGRSNICHSCANEQGTAWRRANPEKVKKINAEHYQKNHDFYIKKRKQWYEKNKPYALEFAKKYRDAHKEAVATRAKQWRANNKAKRALLEMRRYAKKKGAGGQHTFKETQRLLKHQDGKCVYCRADISNKYECDHIVPISKGGHDGIFNIQLLCQSCNRRKHKKMPDVFAQENGYLI